MTSIWPRKRKLVLYLVQEEFKEGKKSRSLQIKSCRKSANFPCLSHLPRAQSATTTYSSNSVATLYPSHPSRKLAHCLQFAAFRLQIRISDAANHRNRCKQRHHPTTH